MEERRDGGGRKVGERDVKHQQDRRPKRKVSFERLNVF